MAEEITLRAYIERIESMIREGRMDEAIAHSAHILQFHPKDAVVYRNMGRALMRLQRYEEASEIFRRLLATIPDDFSSHYQLSIVYENENKGEAAIWHVERAFDQQPNNAQVNDRLRELYKKFKQVDVDKIQLTAGAVALQYYKAGMYNEAITLLQRTLLKVPDRADLITLLARTQWERGDVVDAAETSLDLLKTYPYALEANRILSELWLHEERPSDAQRYLSRVEDIDPYLAYEIATNDDVPDEQFILAELDFSRYAASLASQEQAPDWLANIEELTESERKAQEATPIDDLAFDTDDDIAVAEDNDWLNDLHDNSQPIDPIKKKVTDDLSDLLPDDFSFPDSAGTDDTVDTSELSNLALLEELETDNDFDDLFDDLDDLDTSGTGLTGLLGDDDEDEGTGLTGLLGEDSASSMGLTGMLRKLDADDDDDENPQTDDLSWLDDVSAGNYGADNPSDADEDFFAEMADADNSTDRDETLAWLSTDNLISKDVDDSDEMSTDNLSEAVVDPNDPMAWLQSSGIDFDDDADDSAGFFIEDDPVSIQSSNLDPMAWLEDDIADADDDLALDTNNLDNDATAVTQDDPMAWLADDSIEPDDEMTDDLNLDDEMSWLAESGANNEPDYYETVDTNEILTGQLGNLDDYVPDDIEDDSLEWLTDDEPESSTNDDWLTDDSVLDDLLNIADLTNSDVADTVDDDDLFINTEMQDSMTEQPDWTPDDDFNADDDLGWLENEDLDAQDSLEAEDDSMAWLADENENAIEAEDDSMAWLAEDENAIEAEDDSMAWLANEDDTTIEAEDDAMAWLADEDDTTIEAEDDTMAWLDDDNIIEVEDDPIGDDLPQAKAGTSLLNFLNDDHDVEIDDDFDMLTEEEAFADEGMDWLKTLDGEEVEEIEETVLTTDSDFDSVSDNDVIWDVEDASGGDDFDWGEDEGEAELDWTLESSAETDDFPLDFEDDDELTDDVIAEPASEDWLAELGDNDMTDEPEEEWTANSDFPDEFDDDDSSEDEALEADWLAAFNDDDSDDPAEADWLADIADDSDSDELVAENTDWLSEPETDDVEEDWAVGSGFTDELSDDDDSDDPAEADWLADITADDEDSDDFVAEDTDWLSEPETDNVEEDWTVGSGFTDELSSDDPIIENTDDWAVGSGFTDELSDEVDDAEEDWAVGSGFTDELSDKVDDAEEDWAVGSGFTDELSDEPEEDWLSEVGVVEEDEWSDEDYDSEFEGEYDLNTTTDGMSDMLDTIRTSRDEPTDFETTVDGFDGDEPEWLKQTGEYLAPEQNEEVDWGDDDSDYLEVLPLADIETDDDSDDLAEADWLADMGDDDADEDSVPDWLDTDEVEDDEAIPLAEFDTDDDYDEVFEASSSDSTYLDDYDEDTEQADADNAPDWLNAMVPGLDLDFEAEDEGHLDEGFEERENTLRERRLNESETIKSDFDWLQDIVEEETGVMDAVNDEDMATTPPPTPLAPRKQYEFSLPPVWARDGNATDSIAQAATLASEVPDYLSDFDDFDETPDYDLDDDLNDEFQFESEEIVTVDDEISLSDEDDTVNFEADNDGMDDEPEFVVGDQSFDFDDVDNMIDDSLDTIEDELEFVDDDQSFDFDDVDNMIDDSLDTIEDELDFVDDDQSFDFDTVDNMIDDSLDTIEDELDFVDDDQSFDFDTVDNMIDDSLDSVEDEPEFVVGDQSFDFDDVDNMIDDKLDTDDFSKFDDEFDEFDDDEFDDDFDDEFDEFDDDEFDD